MYKSIRSNAVVAILHDRGGTPADQIVERRVAVFEPRTAELMQKLRPRKPAEMNQQCFAGRLVRQRARMQFLDGRAHQLGQQPNAIGQPT